MTLLSHITLDTGDNPQRSIIWLHGLGADGEDFVPVAQELQLPFAVRYLFPHAPMRPVTLNNGYVMRAWYDIIAAAPNSGLGAAPNDIEDEAGIRASQAEVEKLIAQERRRGIAARRIVLAGFSQGGAIALHTGLRHAEPLGGILALSTYLPLAGSLAREASVAALSTPLFMAHGRADPIIPYALGRASAQKLAGADYQVEWREYAMPHSVCPDEVDDIRRWLALRLA